MSEFGTPNQEEERRALVRHGSESAARPSLLKPESQERDNLHHNDLPPKRTVRAIDSSHWRGVPIFD